MGTKRTFTEGKIFSPLISFAFPVLIALFLQAMYGAVDLWVVGKFGSAADVSAVATGGQVTYTVTVVIVGLSMGITVLIGQKIGEGREKEAGWQRNLYVSVNFHSAYRGNAFVGGAFSSFNAGA